MSSADYRSQDDEDAALKVLMGSLFTDKFHVRLDVYNIGDELTDRITFREQGAVLNVAAARKELCQFLIPPSGRPMSFADPRKRLIGGTHPRRGIDSPDNFNTFFCQTERVSN